MVFTQQNNDKIMLENNVDLWQIIFDIIPPHREL